jgi:hypothetical protein
MEHDRLINSSKVNLVQRSAENTCVLAKNFLHLRREWRKSSCKVTANFVRFEPTFEYLDKV